MTELVVVDDLGYLALPNGATEFVCQVLSERHWNGGVRQEPETSYQMKVPERDSRRRT